MSLWNRLECWLLGEAYPGDRIAQPLRLEQFSPWLRYPGALFAAFVGSLTVLIVLPSALRWLHLTSTSSKMFPAAFAAVNILIGFVGVWTGSLVLVPKERLIGSLLLCVLGITMEVQGIGHAHNQFHVPPGTFDTAVGGSLVVAFYFWRWWARPTEHRLGSRPR